MSQELVIEVTNLSKTYRDGKFRRREIKALEEVTLQVGRGEIFGLLGPNGAGKTTLIKVLLGIVRKTSGEAMLLGKQVGNRKSRTQVGYLPENHRFPQHHTGKSALHFFGALNGLSNRQIKDRMPKLLELVGLTGWEKMPVKKYSKGMQQRLGLAQAMIHDPQLLILDEPTDGVDPVGRKEMRNVLEHLKSEGKSIFINSHLLQEVELVCDRVAILTNGSMQSEGTIEELTKATQTECTFELLANQSAVETILAHRNILRIQSQAAEKQVTVTVAATDQLAVDRCVDDLRKAGISIISLSSPRRTLEEAFLEIVGNSSQSSSQAVEAEVI